MLDHGIEAIFMRMKLYFVAGRMFHGAYHDLVFRKSNVYVDGFLLNVVTSNRETEQIAQERLAADEFRAVLSEHEGFNALCQRFGTIGIGSRFARHEEYHGTWNTFEFQIRHEHLPALEHMAQDEAGFLSEVDREGAARDFRTCFLQRYDNDFERHRRELPLIERSPYLMLE